MANSTQLPAHGAFCLIFLLFISSFFTARAWSTVPSSSCNSTADPHHRTQFWIESRFLSARLWQTDSLELPSTWRTVASVICAAIAVVLSSAGGLGGGGLYVPIFNLLLGFNSNTSAALSSCMIVGGTFVTLLWYSRQRRDDGSGPLINYQISLLCLPGVLLGICAGVMFNVVSPAWLVTLVLIIILFLMTFRSCGNAFKRWNVETAAIQAAANITGADTAAKNVNENKDLEKPLLAGGQVKGLPQYPLQKICILCIIWVVFLLAQIVRGSADGQNFFNIQTCGALYWIVTVAQIPFAFIATVCLMLYLSKKNSEADGMDDEGPSSQQEQPSIQDLRSMTLLSVLALVAGFFGGMLGLGGGMIISPFLSEMGLHPQATAATCSFMVFFSSTLSAIQFWLLGRIPKEFALVAVALSLVFSVVGLQGIQTVIKKYGRVSLIIFAVSAVMGISAALMAIFGTWDVVVQIERGDYMGFRSPCS